MVPSVILRVAVLIAAIGTASSLFADATLQNLHQWRGPEATGVAPNGNPPLRWNERTNIKWKVRIPGAGHATPIVWEDRIFVLTAIKTSRQIDRPANQPKPADPSSVGSAASVSPAAPQGIPSPPTSYYRFVVLCIDRSSGKAKWERIACEEVPHEAHHPTASFASASPITDGNYVYCSFGSRGVYCYDMSGNLVWKQTNLALADTFGNGEGASPALYDRKLILNFDHNGPSFITALNARNGETLWRVDRDEPRTWTTPLVVKRSAGREQVVVNGQNRARGYDLATGAVLWECGGQMGGPIPCSVTIDDLAICMSGSAGGAVYAIPLSSSGDITGTEKIAWRRDNGTPFISSPVLYDGILYYTKDRSGIISSVDARTGKAIIHQKRLPGLDEVYSSPVAAAGRLYIGGRNGVTVVIEAAAKKVNVLAENQLDDTFEASPAIVGKELLLRGEKYLYCIAEE